MYQVWTKEKYNEAWSLTDCPDIAAVEEIIRANFGKEVEVKVSTPVEFDAKIAVKVHAPKVTEIITDLPPAPEPDKKQEVDSEATQSEAEPDKVARGKSDRKVRRGDQAATPGLDKGSGDTGAGPGAGH